MPVKCANGQWTNCSSDKEYLSNGHCLYSFIEAGGINKIIMNLHLSSWSSHKWCWASLYFSTRKPQKLVFLMLEMFCWYQTLIKTDLIDLYLRGSNTRHSKEMLGKYPHQNSILQFWKMFPKNGVWRLNSFIRKLIMIHQFYKILEFRYEKVGKWQNALLQSNYFDQVGGVVYRYLSIFR